ncbi:MAG: S41 family peptidase [Planctomycetaceae bacterium]|nr:S41 family peptidase [Planctomycetaceae bacterium]
MKKIISLVFVLQILFCTSFAYSSETATADSTFSVKSAVQQICDGNFAAAEQIIKKPDANNPASQQILGVIAEYNKLQKTMEDAREKAYQEQLEQLKKFKDAPETNEPNLLEVFPVILKARDFANEKEKASVLEMPYVKETIEKAKKAAAEYEAKGNYINSLIYCYSWLAALYDEDKTYENKREQLEDKAVIRGSMQDSPCESTKDRYEKITPEIFSRTLDMLEYGYVAPFKYNDMAEKAFKRMNSMAEVLSTSTYVETPAESNSTAKKDENAISFSFDKDGIQGFVAGINALQKEYSSEDVSSMSKDQYVKLFKRMLALNLSTIKLPQQIVIWHIGDASLSALDPHTTIIWPKQVEDFEKSMTNEFTGIGVEISKQDGQLKAVSLVPGAPAYHSGIDAGDIIEAVNGESTKDMTITCAVSKITGPAGTKVTLTVRRPDSEKSREITITRARIIVPTIRGWSRDNNGSWLYFVDDKEKIGYVRITQFSATTASDLNNAITKLESEGLKALILDLRFNTGGYLQSAADITDLFVEKGVMVSTQPRVGLPTWETAEKKGTHPNYPLVILINSSSASASEIVSGALSDKAFKRATLVGEQSYGKGSVQTISEYPGGGSQLKYTMAYYHLPSGQRVNDRWAQQKQNKKDWGVMPHIKVEMTGDEMKKMLEMERDNDVLAAADHNDNGTKLKRHDLQETLTSDYQLQIAILAAKAKIIESGLKE